MRRRSKRGFPRWNPGKGSEARSSPPTPGSPRHPASCCSRDTLLEHVSDKGLGSRRFDAPMTDQEDQIQQETGRRSVGLTTARSAQKGAGGRAVPGRQRQTTRPPVGSLGRARRQGSPSLASAPQGCQWAHRRTTRFGGSLHCDTHACPLTQALHWREGVCLYTPAHVCSEQLRL